jgi:hypothetical protein
MADRDTGHLQRAGFAATWRTPEEVWLEGDRLCWDYHGRYKKVTPTADLLDLFVRLSSADDERVLTFARTYGVLRLCEQHKLPVSHLRQVGDSYLSGGGYPCEPLGGYKHAYVPTAYFKESAMMYRAVLNIARRLGDGVAGTYEDWVVLDPDFARAPASTVGMGLKLNDVLRDETPPEELVDIDRETLTDILNQWLDIADVRFRIDWTKGPAPEFSVGVHTLFAALVTGLTMTLTRGGLATCSACGRAYTPKRRPAASRSNYCNEPGCKRVRATNATRASRERKRQKELNNDA